ncbi:MAG: YIP1 family protein [DPANN group archaeon]|nr:YIP1 family protein [DPANN group archaeon]
MAQRKTKTAKHKTDEDYKLLDLVFAPSRFFDRAAKNTDRYLPVSIAILGISFIASVVNPLAAAPGIPWGTLAVFGLSMLILTILVMHYMAVALKGTATLKQFVTMAGFAIVPDTISTALSHIGFYTTPEPIQVFISQGLGDMTSEQLITGVLANPVTAPILLLVLLAEVWGIALFIIGLRQAHKITTLRSIAAYLLGIVLVSIISSIAFAQYI